MKNRDSILIYTREPIKERYSSYLAYSVHLAYSSDGKNYQALNQNYGILFALATIDENDVIRAKGLKKPYIFHTDGGSFGIIAVRTNSDGSNDIESKGKILLWTSEDLITFEERGLLDLKEDVYVDEVICEYNSGTGTYQINWRDEEGNCYRNTLSDLNDKDSISSAEPVSGHSFSLRNELTNLELPEGAIKGNVIYIDQSLGKKLQIEWSPLENIAVEVQDSVQANSVDDVESIKATAIYTDGSTAVKQVKWETDSIDFTHAGAYEISGTVLQEKYDFPLAIGYADPVIIKWEGKYYYTATNDNVNDIGIFVREADTVAGFFEEGVEEYLILDKDESRNLIQTFWAPEFHLVDGQLYIFFAVSGQQWGPQCHVMKLKDGGKITDPGSWTHPIRVVKRDGSNLTEDGITLDMTYFEVDHTSYVVWSYRYRIGRPDDTGSMLYIATVDPAKPWQLTSEPVLLSRPLYGWENIEGTINNEGPYPLVTDEYVYITYSGGAATGYTYALGLLSIERGKDLLDVDNWRKSSTPVLSYYSIEGEYGPGHNAFYTNDRGDVMITYHGEPTMSGSPRCTGIRRVHFDINNKPRFDMSPERDLNSEFVQVNLKVIVTEKV